MTNRATENLELRRGQQDRMSRMATGAIVLGTDPVKGTLNWRGIRGGESTAVSHPYIGPTSWFRINPERGTKVLISYRGENLAPYVSAYIAEDINGSAVATLHSATASGKFWFRRLNEGEMEITSPGNASTAWLRNGNVEMRGGAVALTLSNTEMVAHADAPTHRLTTLGSRLRHVGDEQRFGAVTRASSIDPTQTTAVKVQGEFAKEYLRHLSDPSGAVAFVDHREGVVVEDTGTPAVINGIKLRLRSQYGTTNGVVSLTIDETGNVSVMVPQSQSGFTLKTLESDIKLDSGKDLNVLVSKSIVANARMVEVTADSIKLAGSQRLLMEGFSSTLAGAAALPPAAVAGPALAIATSAAVSVNAVIAYLQTFPGGFNSSLTTKTVAG